MIWGNLSFDEKRKEEKKQEEKREKRKERKPLDQCLILHSLFHYFYNIVSSFPI